VKEAMIQEVESSSKKNLRSFFKFVSVEERVQGMPGTKGRPKGPRKVANEVPVMTGRTKLRQVLQDINSKSSSRERTKSREQK
jgi:hypothetical protein